MTPQEIQIITIETIYALLIIIPALIIYYKVYKLYEFSKYRGLKYFSNAFLFSAIGFFIRYFVILNNVLVGNAHQTIQTFNVLLIIMEFFMIMTGMFLLYTLIWQKLENKKYSRNPINKPLFFMYLLAFLFAIIDHIFNSLLLLYLSQVIILGVATIIAYKNYLEKKQYYKQIYFITITLFFITMIINFIAQYTINTYPVIRFYTYIITTIVIFLFLYMTNKLTKKIKILK